LHRGNRGLYRFFIILLGRTPFVAAILLLAAVTAGGQTTPPALEPEIARIDRLGANPELKLPLLHAMARELGTHRNRLILLKKQTGESFGRIYVKELRARGHDDRAILARLRKLNRSFQEGPPPETPEGWEGSVRPILFLGATADHNSAGTFITLTPEAGIDTRRAAFVVGVPLYRISAAQLRATGIGDAYAALFLRQRAGRFDLGSSLTVGFPTGNRDQGLGSGKVTVDLNGAVEGRFERLRPFAGGGFTNSVFNNVGYQRPFISNGNAWYATGGIDAQLHRRIVAGAGGFALHATGAHTVISRMNRMMPPGHDEQPGAGGNGTPGMGHGTPPHPSEPPFYGQPRETVVPGDELSDHGPSAWVVFTLHPTVSLNVTVARSLPYELTTVRVGLGFNLAGVLSRARRAR
jgi:hypothetical protein